MPAAVAFADESSFGETTIDFKSIYGFPREDSPAAGFEEQAARRKRMEDSRNVTEPRARPAARTYPAR